MLQNDLDVPKLAPCLSRLTLHQVLRVTEEITKAPMKELVSSARWPRLVRARYIYVYAAMTLTLRSLTDIGRLINRDHSTVIHGLDKVRHRRKDFEPELSQVMAKLEGMLG